MKKLNEIVAGVDVLKALGSTDIEISGLSFDSRKVETGHVFIAVPGTLSDGHDYIEKAISLGAVAVVCERMPEAINGNITYLQVSSSSASLGLMASLFYDNPSASIHLVGVTGTNGKTTIASLLYKLFMSLGIPCGLFSTIRNLILDKPIDATHTTPDSIQLNKLLRDMVDAGCEYCFMEVSSHAVSQNRIAGLTYRGGVFTNLTHDHLDYHKTFQEYLKAKKTFFDALNDEAFAITNGDDKNGMVMLQNTKATKIVYALRTPADFKCKVLENHFDGMLLNINGTELWTKLIGRFNAYNLLAIYAVALQLGIQKEELLQKLSGLTTVDGRFEYFRSESDVTAIVDYAHTPDALKNVLQTISEINGGAGRIISVIGAGGDRDKTKRPEMTRNALVFSDQVVLTSDNPRSEEPADIIEDMKAGAGPSEMRKVLVITDRREAIRTACTLAQKGDIVLVAGKGHETYQEIKGIRHHFDDREIIQEYFKS